MTALHRWQLLDERDAAPLDAHDDAAARLALLAAVGDGTSPPVVRLVRPGPTAAFSRRDALLPGFAAARESARRHGFAPVVRPVGGRMAPYHRGCLVLDLVGDAGVPGLATTRDRFELVAGAVVAALRALGLDARAGEVPREYCPGEHSVNLGGAVKVAGTAQRQTRAAWLVSALVVAEGADTLRAVTTDVYADLGLDLDPATVGAAGLDAGVVGDALLAALLATPGAASAGRVAPWTSR